MSWALSDLSGHRRSSGQWPEERSRMISYRWPIHVLGVTSIFTELQRFFEYLTPRGHQRSKVMWPCPSQFHEVSTCQVSSPYLQQCGRLYRTNKQTNKQTNWQTYRNLALYISHTCNGFSTRSAVKPHFVHFDPGVKGHMTNVKPLCDFL